MTFEVTLSDGAEQDVAAIYNWIACRSADVAARWYQAFRQAVTALSYDPQRFPVAPESREFELPIRNATFRMPSRRVYRILFMLTANHVEILFVRGPGQDFATP